MTLETCAIQYRYKHLYALLAEGRIDDRDRFVEDTSKSFGVELPSLSHEELPSGLPGIFQEEGKEHIIIPVDTSHVMVTLIDSHARFKVISTVSEEDQRDQELVEREKRKLSDLMERLITTDSVTLKKLTDEDRRGEMIREFDRNYGDNGIELHENAGRMGDIGVAFSYEMRLALNKVGRPEVGIIKLGLREGVRGEFEK